jgi:hypothetical protein
LVLYTFGSSRGPGCGRLLARQSHGVAFFFISAFAADAFAATVSGAVIGGAASGWWVVVSC